MEPGGSLPATQLNLLCQDDGRINSGSGPLVTDEFTRLCSPAQIHQRGLPETAGVPYPESFDYSEPLWLHAPFGAQHQVTK